MDSPDEALGNIFRGELQEQTARLSTLLVALEKSSDRAALEPLMRVTHSLKGAARAIGFESLAGLAHAMEDRFVEASRGRSAVTPDLVDALLAALDLLVEVAAAPDMAAWSTSESGRIDEAIRRLEAPSPTSPAAPVAPPPAIAADRGTRPSTVAHERRDSVVRIGIEAMAQLVGTAGEVYVESQRLQESLRLLPALRQNFNALNDALSDLGRAVDARPVLEEARARAAALGRAIAAHEEALDARATHLAEASERLYDRALGSRMRPFGDAVRALPRLVRDGARELEKSARLVTEGERTLVDRDVLSALEGLLTHLVNNAIDHGLEGPKDRADAGKPEEGVVRVEARHAGGMVDIAVTDDGRGIDLERVRARAIEAGLVKPSTAASLGQDELLQFLFLPGFSTARTVGTYSGRGVGLDAVKTEVERVGGSVALSSVPGRSTTVRLRLPVTRSVLRALLVVIGGQTWGLPLQQVDRIARVAPEEAPWLEGRRYLHVDGENPALVHGAAVLELPLPEDEPPESLLTVVVLRRGTERLGLVVERLVGEEDVVVRPLDPRLGPVQNVASTAILRDGSPTLILDVDDLARSAARLLGRASPRTAAADEAEAPRILVADDSITVREIQRQILLGAGYTVEVAVDGMDAWNLLANGGFALLVTDLDMPRRNGLELTRLVRQSAHHGKLPVIVVSYKDQPADRAAAFAAGADVFVGKSGFSDAKLLEAVRSLLAGDAR